MKTRKKPNCNYGVKCQRWDTYWCGTCTNNRDVKKDYYQRNYPYPYYWWGGTTITYCGNDTFDWNTTVSTADTQYTNYALNANNCSTDQKNHYKPRK